MKEAVRKFNTIAGKLSPDLVDNPEKMWEALLGSAERAYEEAKEMLEAAKNKDIKEFLDGLVDVKYTEAHAQLLLEMLGVDVIGAGEEVCKNNNMKFFNILDDAMTTARTYSTQDQECREEEVVYEGERLYVVKRVKDNKVMKPIGHPSPMIEEFIPKEVLDKMSL